MSKERLNIPRVAVGVLIVNEGGEVFLGKSPKWENKWIVPGGHLEYGEGLDECVVREIHEELGIIVDPESITFFQVQEEIFPSEFSNPDRHFVFLNYVADFPGGEIVINREFSQYCFIKPGDALETLELNASTRTFLTSYSQNNDNG